MVYKGTTDSNFRKFVVDVASPLVLRKLVNKNSMLMWNLMIRLSIEPGGFGQKIFESICQSRMLGDAKVYFDYQYHDGTTNLVNGQPGSSLQLGGCIAIKGTQENLIAAANREELVLYYSLNPDHKFIDFVYREHFTYHAFKITLAESHTCDPKDLANFAEKAGGPLNFFLYYLTCENNHGKFILQPKNLLEDLPGKNWTIHVLCMPRPNDEQEPYRW
jgi:hypothetical protein